MRKDGERETRNEKRDDSYSSFLVLLPSLSSTQAFAQRIAPHLRQGDVVALQGDLGTGKTAFARALLYALGVTDDVPSPTFTLLQSYDVNGVLISHFDLYRLKSPDELDELGWEDALADGIALVEWPERAVGRLPTDSLVLRFALDEKGERSCVVEAQGKWQEIMHIGCSQE